MGEPLLIEPNPVLGNETAKRMSSDVKLKRWILGFAFQVEAARFLYRMPDGPPHERSAHSQVLQQPSKGNGPANRDDAHAAATHLFGLGNVARSLHVVVGVHGLDNLLHHLPTFSVERRVSFAPVLSVCR